MKKVLVIPDIHTNFVWAESIIMKHNPDNIIFLGDYFDKFYETLEDTHNTAYWLQESLKKKNRIHLIGNHDLNYMTENLSLKCGGYTKDKYNIVKQYDIEWGKMQLYCWCKKWLCTHAGLSMNFLKSNNLENKPLEDILQMATDSLKTIDDCGDDNIFLQAGEMRGSIENEYGGIVWCDYNEFADLPNLKQIFGHTPAKEVRRKQNHICMDTQGKNYALYDVGSNQMWVLKS